MHSPFKFLDAYEKKDVDQFFGREKETAQLYNAVFASNLTLLYGASGTGKTSLVNCGLGNKFYETDWLPIFIRREADLNHSLNNAIIRRLKASASPGFPELPIGEKIQQLFFDHYKPIYLIFDQFEELFILGTAEERNRFYRTIAELLSAGLQAKVLFIIREEWIAYLDEFERLLPALFENRLRIERMNDRNVYRVISGTARFHNIQVTEPGKTILQIIDNLRDRHERVDLTNLQVYLDRLWRADQERQGGKAGQITFDPALVEQVGKMENVLSEFLDEQLQSLEGKLSDRGVRNSKGLPLEILFTLVTDDGTKQALSSDEIIDNLPRNRKINRENLAFLMEEFRRIKIMRQIDATEE